MFAQFCSNCKFIDYPDCVLKNIIKNISFEELLNNKLKYEQYPVCPLNAQIIHEGKLELTDKCDTCTFCQLLCVNYEKQDLSINNKLEKIFFSDYNRLQMLLKKWNSTLKIASEVLFNGNFRSKRLDLVIINDSKVFLVKILKDINKYDYYNRSLEYIKKEYTLLYSNLEFKSIFLVYNNSINKNDESIITINELLNLTRRV